MLFRSLLSLLVFLVALALAPVVLAETEKPPLIKLHAVHTEMGNRPRLDTVYHYLSEQAEKAYADGELPKAEKLYGQALADAEKTKASPQIDAALHTNLGAVLRDEHNYSESEKHFKAAIEIERTKLRGQAGLMDYTAKHYAALLTKTGRAFDALAIQESAKNGFTATPVAPKPATVTQDTFDTSITSDESKSRKKEDGSGGDFETVEYTITLKPIPSNSDFSHVPPALVKAAKIPLVSGAIDFYIDSDIHPVHVVCPVPPDTGLWGNAVEITETWRSPKFSHPIENQSTIGAPCKIEPVTMTETCRFKGKAVKGEYRFVCPSAWPTGAMPDKAGCNGFMGSYE